MGGSSSVPFDPICPPVKPRCFSGLSCGVGTTPAGESRWATFSFDAFDYLDHDGVRHVAADVTGDSKPELVVTRRATTARAFEVRIYQLAPSVTPGGEQTMRQQLWLLHRDPLLPESTGLELAVGKLGADDSPHLATAAPVGGQTQIDLWRIEVSPKPALVHVTSVTHSAKSPTLTAVDVDADGTDELIIADGDEQQDSTLSILRFPDEYLLQGFAPVAGARNGLLLAAGDLDGDGTTEIVVGLGPAKENDSKLRAYHWAGDELVEVATWELLSEDGYGAVPLVGDFLASDGAPAALEVAAATGANVAGKGSLPAEVVIANACGQIHHTIRPDFFEETFFFTFNGASPAMTMAGMGAGTDTTTLLDGLAPGGLGPHFQFVPQMGGHYLTGTYLEVDDATSSNPQLKPGEPFRIQNAQKDSFVLDRLDDYLKGEGAQVILSSPMNQWSVKAGDPWQLIEAKDEVLAVRYLTLDKNQFMVTNQGENWRDILLPNFDPATPSPYSADSKGLFYWNVSTLAQAGGVDNEVFHWRERVHRDRMRLHGHLHRSYPNFVSRYDMGGEMELFSGNFNKGKFYSARYGDYSAFSLSEFRAWLQPRHDNIAALNAAFGTNFGSWQQIDPPRGAGFGPHANEPTNCIPLSTANPPNTCLSNPWWDEWHTFRVEQVRRITEWVQRVAYEEGISPHRIGAHQIPGTAGVGYFTTTHDSHWATPLETAHSKYGRMGITAYGSTATDPELWSYVAGTTHYLSIGEYNPMPPPQNPGGQSYDTVRNALETAYAGGAQSIAYHTWHVQYGIFNPAKCKPSCSWQSDPPSPLADPALAPAVLALMDFIGAHAYGRRLELGSGVTVSAGDFDGDGLDDIITNLGGRIDGRTEPLLKLWHTVLDPFTP